MIGWGGGGRTNIPHRRSQKRVNRLDSNKKLKKSKCFIQCRLGTHSFSPSIVPNLYRTPRAYSAELFPTFYFRCHLPEIRNVEASTNFGDYGVWRVHDNLSVRRWDVSRVYQYSYSDLGHCVLAAHV